MEACIKREGIIINSLVTGNTSVCDRKVHNFACSTKETFFHDFLVILKEMISGLYIQNIGIHKHWNTIGTILVSEVFSYKKQYIIVILYEKTYHVIC